MFPRPPPPRCPLSSKLIPSYPVSLLSCLPFISFSLVFHVSFSHVCLSCLILSLVYISRVCSYLSCIPSMLPLVSTSLMSISHADLSCVHFSSLPLMQTSRIYLQRLQLSCLSPMFTSLMSITPMSTSDVYLRCLPPINMSTYHAYLSCPSLMSTSLTSTCDVYVRCLPPMSTCIPLMSAIGMSISHKFTSSIPLMATSHVYRVISHV